jgi:hypothetical protein
MIKADFPTSAIAVLTMILAYGGRYNEILAGIIVAGFVSIVVNSNKYPKVNEFFDTVF